MKIVVLVDNNTYIDEYYGGEPGVCYYIEEKETKILFDTGYSDLFMRNAKKAQIDLNGIHHMVFSHGHNDHTRGFSFFADKLNPSQVTIVAHPDALKEKWVGEESIGSVFSKERMEENCKVVATKEPIAIGDKFVFLGEIPASNSFEKRESIGIQKNGEEKQPDYVMDDSALVYCGEEGLFIITGCSHSGICNMIEYAKKVCKDHRIAGILGGFHLFEENERLEKTIQYFEENNIKELYPCHCVSFPVKARIHQSIRIHEVGVGMNIYVK